MDFYDRVGTVALGSRLRRVGDWLAEEAGKVYRAYGTELQPRWFPVYQLLTERGSESVGAIAQEIGQTHASVSQIVTEMRKQGYVRVEKAPEDGRKTVVVLTRRGCAADPRIRAQCRDVGVAAEALLAESGGRLWEALREFERALARRGLFERTMDERQRREGEGVEIVAYAPKYRAAFRRLNDRWIRQHFTLEPTDRRMLEDPEGVILRPGGHILVALAKGKPAGVCALLPHGERCFELAKMTVAESARGRGIGHRLGVAAIDKARAHGATRLYLETNTKLRPAIALYRKLGFKEIKGGCSPYCRCNFQMELPIPAAERRNPTIGKPTAGRRSAAPRK